MAVPSVNAECLDVSADIFLYVAGDSTPGDVLDSNDVRSNDVITDSDEECVSVVVVVVVVVVVAVVVVVVVAVVVVDDLEGCVACSSFGFSACFVVTVAFVVERQSNLPPVISGSHLPNRFMRSRRFWTISSLFCLYTTSYLFRTMLANFGRSPSLESRFVTELVSSKPSSEEENRLIIKDAIICNRALDCPHVRQSKFCLRGQVGFLGVLPFSPIY